MRGRRFLLDRLVDHEFLPDLREQLVAGLHARSVVDSTSENIFLTL